MLQQYYAQNVNKTKTYFHQHVIFKEFKFVVIDMYVTNSLDKNATVIYMNKIDTFEMWHDLSLL